MQTDIKYVLYCRTLNTMYSTADRYTKCTVLQTDIHNVLYLQNNTKIYCNADQYKQRNNPPNRLKNNIKYLQKYT